MKGCAGTCFNCDSDTEEEGCWVHWKQGVCPVLEEELSHTAGGKFSCKEKKNPGTSRDCSSLPSGWWTQSEQPAPEEQLSGFKGLNWELSRLDLALRAGA